MDRASQTAKLRQSGHLAAHATPGAGARTSENTNSCVGATALADWLKTHAAPTDHLRLQKLLFYCFGAGTAYGLDAELGDIRFHAWRHGPVNVEVFNEHRGNGRETLVATREAPAYSHELTQVLLDVLGVYGRLSAWQLREESHDELPWCETEQSAEISPQFLRDHFRLKFAQGAVRLPRQLVRAWSFDVDGVPLQSWPDLHTLANALRA